MPPIMYVGKHAIYQQLLYRDMQIRVEAPPEVSAYIRDKESFSRSGDESRGEGGDYITENENRILKKNLPPGVPTLQSYKVFSRIGIEDPSDQKSSIFNHEMEVQMVRREIRVSGMLSNPLEEKPLTSIEGNILHPDLVNIFYTCLDNYNMYKVSPTEAHLKPLFCNICR